MIRIVLVDDHVLFSNSLKKLIDGYTDFEVVAQVTNGEEYIQLVKKEALIFDLVLLDVKMPIMDGLETMNWIKIHQANMPVLILSMEHDDDTIVKMLKLGAKGYVLKDIDPEEFKVALTFVSRNKFYHNEKTSSLLLDKLVNNESVVENLKEREIEFLKFICKELTYKEIANQMHLSPKTVDGYRETLFKKTGAKSRTGLVMYAIKNKIVAI